MKRTTIFADGLFSVLRLIKDRRGTTLPLMAAIMIPMMGFIGLATDAARAYVVKARLGDALDAAGLASAHEVYASDFEAQVTNYFKANFPDGYLGATAQLNAPVLSNNDLVLTLTASAQITTTFMQFFGYQTLNVVSSTQVTRQTTSMDVAISVDMSGSMTLSDGSGSTRIQAARTAAKTMVDILYGASNGSNLVNVGLVPWNGSVNVFEEGAGPFAPGLTTTTSVPSFTNPWTGSVQTDIYYASNSPVPLLSSPPPGWDGCAFARYRPALDPEDQGDVRLAPGTFDTTEWLGWEPNDNGNDCLSHGITPLTNTQSVIENAIDGLTNPKYDTNIPQGLAWAWRVVSPGAPYNQANPNPQGNHQRAIVLMTDGENSGWSTDAYDGVFGNYTPAGPNGMDDRLRELATNIKQEGTKIYVIQFYHNSGALTDLMKEIASGATAPYYHFAPDGDALKDAFEQVADELSSLRISR